MQAEAREHMPSQSLSLTLFSSNHTQNGDISEATEKENTKKGETVGDATVIRRVEEKKS